MRNSENKLDNQLLDRLVDGELTDSECRAALGLVESHPDGWRRCALAFLEAQAWGRDFRQVRNEATAAAPVEIAGRRRWPWLYIGTMAVGCAASFLLAFGIAIRLQTPAVSTPDQNHLAVQTSSSPAQIAAVEPDHPLAGFENAASSSIDNGTAQSPIGRYQLVVDGKAGASQTVEMPVFAADDPRAGLLLDEYASMPREIIRALQQSGNDVQRRRNWVPMPAKTGSPLYVPIDEIQVTPVSSHSFQ